MHAALRDPRKFRMAALEMEEEEGHTQHHGCTVLEFRGCPGGVDTVCVDVSKACCNRGCAGAELDQDDLSLGCWTHLVAAVAAAQAQAQTKVVAMGAGRRQRGLRLDGGREKLVVMTWVCCEGNSILFPVSCLL